ncbi:hypothetical protein O181_000155 [Austropuccinia psidii MF-1]|uniref:Uncharacterized protein n=1 Tax=Austropuccinia psidii MF-1 TaxID=1389203 RepID=A0A9Q3B8D0_9BASI|nr:hypothetical protein [Austropuccinia psidii MF-1]
MNQTLEDMIRRFIAYYLELKYPGGITHHFFTLIPELELAYKNSTNASTGVSPTVLEKGWNTKLSVDTLMKYLADFHSTASIFKIFIDKVRNHANQSMTDSIEYAKQKCEKSYKTLEFKVGDSLLVLTLNFKKTKGPKKLNYSFSGPFIIKDLHGKNSVQVELSGELEKKHPAFPFSLVKCYTSSDKELFPLRNEIPLCAPPLDQSEEKKVLKI